LDRRLGKPQSRSGCSGNKKNSQPLPGLEPSIIQPVAQYTLLSYPKKDKYSRFKYLCKKMLYIYVTCTSPYNIGNLFIERAENK
jgi:hypothetical protein